jgi:hypothetical protein
MEIIDLALSLFVLPIGELKPSSNILESFGLFIIDLKAKVLVLFSDCILVYVNFFK